MTDQEFDEVQKLSQVLIRFGEVSARMRAAEGFLARLAENATSKPQEIVSTGRLTAEEISAAREEGRLLVIDGALGFVIRPMSQHPENFKWWYWKCQQHGCQCKLADRRSA